MERGEVPWISTIVLVRRASAQSRSLTAFAFQT
jgi:hypothetical protein